MGRSWLSIVKIVLSEIVVLVYLLLFLGLWDEFALIGIVLFCYVLQLVCVMGGW